MGYLLINLLIILAIPFIYIGVINKTKAVFSGRKGAPIIQPFFDFIKLMRKGEIISTTTTYVFQISSVIFLSTVVFAGLLIPGAGHQSILMFEGNFILFVYILSIGKFFMLINAMDTGSSFEGMGASREAFYSSIPEPAFFIILGALCLFQDTFTFDKLVNVIKNRSELGILIVILISAILFIILLIEGKRIPIDDPNTHLELTMIHEVMALDNSGPSLGFIQYGSAMKMVLISMLILDFLIPANLGLPVSVGLLLIGLYIIAIAIGVIESTIARFRLVRIPDFILPTLSMSLIVMFIILILAQGGLK